MLKILEAFQTPAQPPVSQSEDFLNLMKTIMTPQPKQVSNIILSSNIPENREEQEEIKKPVILPQNSIKFEERNSDQDNKSQVGSQNMNEFIFLSKVATMCNQMNDEERQNRKEKTIEKDEEEEKDFDDLKFKSKKMFPFYFFCYFK